MSVTVNVRENACLSFWNTVLSKASLIHLQLNQMSDNPYRNKQNEKCCSQFNTYFKRHMAFRKADESLVSSDKT
jgi:hypothetical protein